MVWDCMSSKCVGKLVLIKGKMDKYEYKSILTKNLNDSVEKIELDENHIFQQDNDPKHTSSILPNFFEKKDICRMKSELRKIKLPIGEEVIEIWNNISVKVRLGNTMNDRVNCVLRDEGKQALD